MSSQVVNMIIAGVVSSLVLSWVLPRLRGVATFQDAGLVADAAPASRLIYPP